MKILGKEKLITKLETYIEIKNELDYRTDLDKYLFKKVTFSGSNGSKEYYEDILLKLNLDKILLKQVQRYIHRTCEHFISHEMCESNDKDFSGELNNISRQVVQFFKELKDLNIDYKEKIQLVDLNCSNFVDVYVILNYIGKDCEESKVEKILQLIQEMFRRAN